MSHFPEKLRRQEEFSVLPRTAAARGIHGGLAVVTAIDGGEFAESNSDRRRSVHRLRDLCRHRPDVLLLRARRQRPLTQRTLLALPADGASDGPRNPLQPERTEPAPTENRARGEDEAQSLPKGFDYGSLCNVDEDPTSGTDPQSSCLTGSLCSGSESFTFKYRLQDLPAPVDSHEILWAY